MSAGQRVVVRQTPDAVACASLRKYFPRAARRHRCPMRSTATCRAGASRGADAKLDPEGRGSPPDITQRSRLGKSLPTRSSCGASHMTGSISCSSCGEPMLARKGAFIDRTGTVSSRRPHVAAKRVARIFRKSSHSRRSNDYLLAKVSPPLLVKVKIQAAPE